MSILFGILVFLHIVCWATALGLWVAAAKTRQPNKALFHSLGGVLILGAAMFGLSGALGFGDHMWMGIKFVLLLIATVFSVIAVKKQEQTPAAIWFSIPVLLIGTIAYAVFA